MTELYSFAINNLQYDNYLNKSGRLDDTSKSFYFTIQVYIPELRIEKSAESVAQEQPDEIQAREPSPDQESITNI